jgi:hypothetical protein
MPTTPEPEMDDAIWIDEHEILDRCEFDGCTESPTTIFVAVTRDCETLLRFTCALHAADAVPVEASEVMRLGAERPRKFVFEVDSGRRLD